MQANFAMIWTCQNCGIVMPMQPHEFPINCACGLIQKTHDADPLFPASKGVGDTVARITRYLGIKPCGGCKKRQKWLNEKLPYKD